jgi:hypothetical protein
MNSIMVIAPYKYLGMWVFDDDAKDLLREPFVGGTDEIIDLLTAGIEDADKGFRLVFASSPFPDCQFKLIWQREELSGNTYLLEGTEAEGWLCPALLKYFDSAPQTIYFKVEPLAQ